MLSSCLRSNLNFYWDTYPEDRTKAKIKLSKKKVLKNISLNLTSNNVKANNIVFVCGPKT